MIHRFTMPNENLTFEEKRLQYEKRAEFAARFEEFMDTIDREPTAEDVSAAIKFANGDNVPKDLEYDIDENYS